MVVSILDGKGASMPAFRGKLSEEEARALMWRIRAFGPEQSFTSPAGVREPSDSEAQFEQLLKELKDLQRQIKELNAATRDREKPPAPVAENDQNDALKASLQPVAALYRQHCQRCHGADGKGDPKKSGTDRPRDFTGRHWQQQRSDAQLIATVLDGKGTTMPALGKKLSKEEVEALVDYIRAFNPRRSTAPSKLRTPPEG
jgi:mono/diheme cytochrome c family protein